MSKTYTKITILTLNCEPYNKGNIVYLFTVLTQSAYSQYMVVVLMFGFMWFYRQAIKHNIKHSDIADNYDS